MLIEMKKKRKIGFYYLTLNSSDFNIQDVFVKLIDTIISNDKAERKENLNGDKFCLLDYFKKFTANNRCHLVFKSATHSFRPPLLDSETATERDNPKRLQEGERHKTHIISKAINGDLILIVEKGKDTLNMNQIVSYLNHFLPLLDLDVHLRFGYEIIAKDNFLEEVKNLNRVLCADVFVDKQLLGSQSLNYSERLNSVQHEVSINVKANIRDSIVDFVYDLYSKFNGGSNSIRRIRIVGKNHENNEVKINTDFIERQEYVLVQFDKDTGEILSNEMLIEMDTVLHNFN